MYVFYTVAFAKIQRKHTTLIFEPFFIFARGLQLDE